MTLKGQLTFGDAFKEDGEPIPCVVISSKGKKGRYPSYLSFWTVSSGIGVAMSELIQNKNMRAIDLKLVIHTLNIVTPGNFVNLRPQSKIAEKLGVDRKSISRAINRLLDLRYIEQIKDSSLYRLNPAVAWHGSLSQGTKERTKAINTELKRRKEEADMSES